MSELTVSQLEQEIDRLSAELERKEDRGQTVTPDERNRIAGLQTLLRAKRANAGNDDRDTHHA